MKTITYTDKDCNLNNTVVALGKFEGLHLGHKLLLDEVLRVSKEYNLSSVVCTIDADFNQRINTIYERNILLSDMGIDYNVSCPFTNEFASLTPEFFVKNILVKSLNPSWIVVGEDFRFGCKRSGDVEFLETLGKKYNFKVVSFPKLAFEGTVISSSVIRSLIEMGELEKVNNFLGRPYMVVGTVKHGKMLGRTIGFPTVNIYPDASKLLLPKGVYETRVQVNNQCYKGITNIGENPTVEQSKQIKIETHILEYEGDLYERELQISFVRFLRPQMKFGSIENLKNQIKKDKMFVMHQ